MRHLRHQPFRCADLQSTLLVHQLRCAGAAARDPKRERHKRRGWWYIDHHHYERRAGDGLCADQTVEHDACGEHGSATHCAGAAVAEWEHLHGGGAGG